MLRVLKILLVVFSITFLIHLPSVFAQSDEQKLQDLNNQISQLQNQLNDAKNQEKTLSSQLAFIDGQAKLTQLKIDQTNFQITKLDKEIVDLNERIGRLSSNVDKISAILLERITKTSKYSNITTLDLLFSSKGFADLLERIKYIEVVQAHDKKVLYELQATKATYNDQKNDKQTRQAQEEKLKKDLDAYQTQLDQEKAAKAALLRITQNNESVYQAKLQAALAEQQAILSIAGNFKNEIPDGHVNKGDIIGRFITYEFHPDGSSPCSSGKHLHFEVHQNDSIQNPANFLSSTSINKWDNSPPDSQFSFSGSWDWPIDQPIDIEQGYGMTWWAQHGWYGGGPHTGIDIYSESSTSVRAVHDGALSHGSIPCQSGSLLYKRIDHGDGISSYYLHVI